MAEVKRREAPELQGFVLIAVIVILALGNFLAMLDLTITNVLVPHIAGALGASPSDATWVITAFAAANGVTVPLTGWLMGRFGVVRTFVVSVSLFTLTSFLCGLSTSLPILVVFRLLQGGVSGPMIPGSQALLIAIFRYQPSPFCILDEVDAPLDETNVGRFTKLVSEMSIGTQFIVVTHNRRTMEMASVLYGVTMQEPGVSKLVSVRWDEQANAQAATNAA